MTKPEQTAIAAASPKRTKLRTSDMPGAVEVAGTFNNCFFHAYAVYLLVNTLPLPDNLFDFTSVLGSDSPASKLQKFFPDAASLEIFSDYQNLLATHSKSQHIMEKTLVLGILFREWFATQLADNQHRRLEMLLSSTPGQERQRLPLCDQFRSYREMREAKVSAEELRSQSALVDALQDEFEAFADSPTPTTDTEIIAEEKKIRALWTDSGYRKYCQHLATLDVKVAADDFLPVLKRLKQPYDIDGIICQGPSGIPPFCTQLDAKEGHFYLFTNHRTDEVLNDYASQQANYSEERDALQRTENKEARRAIYRKRSSLFLAATCRPEVGLFDLPPFSLLLIDLEDMQCRLNSHRKATVDSGSRSNQTQRMTPVEQPLRESLLRSEASARATSATTTRQVNAAAIVTPSLSTQKTLRIRAHAPRTKEAREEAKTGAPSIHPLEATQTGSRRQPADDVRVAASGGQEAGSGALASTSSIAPSVPALDPGAQSTPSAQSAPNAQSTSSSRSISTTQRPAANALDATRGQLLATKPPTDYHFLLLVGSGLAGMGSTAGMVIGILAIVSIISLGPIGIALTLGASVITGGFSYGFFKQRQEQRPAVVEASPLLQTGTASTPPDGTDGTDEPGTSNTVQP